MDKDIKPNYDYLQQKFSISDPQTLKQRVLETCSQLDMEAMAKDVEPFLFDASDVRKVVRFEDVVKQYAL